MYEGSQFCYIFTTAKVFVFTWTFSPFDKSRKVINLTQEVTV